MLTAMRPERMPRTRRRSGSSLRAVKEALQRVEEGADPRCEAAEVSHHLDLLTERLRRLHGLGGEFAGVRFSPGVERLRAAFAAEP